jgi:hypothetical protein
MGPPAKAQRLIPCSQFFLRTAKCIKLQASPLWIYLHEEDLLLSGDSNIVLGVRVIPTNQ